MPCPGTAPVEGGRQRTVSSDRYSAYSHLISDDRAIRWSHLDRDFQGWEEARGAAAPFGERALALTDQLFEQWHRFRAGEFDRPELCARLLPIQGAFRDLLEAAHASGHWKVAGPARELLKHREALWTFSRHEGVEPTNNHAERVLRHAVRWRKGSFGHQSEPGRTFVERMLTLVTSLRLQGRNVLTYLEGALRASLTGTAAPSPLPAAVASHVAPAATRHACFPIVHPASPERLPDRRPDRSACRCANRILCSVEMKSRGGGKQAKANDNR